MSIGPPACGWRFALWNDRIRLAVAPVVILLFAVLFANVVEMPGAEPWLWQGAAGSLLAAVITALLGTTIAIRGAGLVRCRQTADKTPDDRHGVLAGDRCGSGLGRRLRREAEREQR
jgi:hypothetical protein